MDRPMVLVAGRWRCVNYPKSTTDSMNRFQDPGSISSRNRTSNSKIQTEPEKTQNSKPTLKENSATGDVTLSDFENSAIIKASGFWHKDRHTDQWNCFLIGVQGWGVGNMPARCWVEEGFKSLG